MRILPAHDGARDARNTSWFGPNPGTLTVAGTAYVLGVPLISRSAVDTTTPEAKGAPLERWQSAQWQFSMAMGALAHV